MEGARQDHSSRRVLVFGWTGLIALTLLALPVGIICLFALLFADSPGSAEPTLFLVVLVGIGIVSIWIWLLIALIRKRISYFLGVITALLIVGVSGVVILFVWSIVGQTI